MKFTQEQQLFQHVVNEAWENAEFKTELMTNPVSAIEKLTGQKLNIPEGKTLVVRDQTNENNVYINISNDKRVQEDVELTEEQLEIVSGGIIGDGCVITPFKPLQDLIIKNK